MNLRVFVPKIYLDRTELPILNEFPLGIFFATLYVVALPKLWQQVVFGVQSTVTDSVSWSATEYSNQNVVSDPLLWSAGINIKNTLLGSLAWPASEWWSTSISSHTATTISTCEDEFSKDVVESLAQADDILAGILADQEPLLALPIVIGAMDDGLSSLIYLHRTYKENGITKYNRTTPPSPPEIVVKTQEKLLAIAKKELTKLPQQHAWLANITLLHYHQSLADLRQLETFSQKRSGYVKLRSFFSSKYAAKVRHSQYYESRALEIVHDHIQYVMPIVDHTLNMSKSLHQLFRDIALFPDRLQKAVDATATVKDTPETATTDSNKQIATLLSHFNNNKTVNEWLINKTGGINWLPRMKEIFGNGNTAYGDRIQELGELYTDLSKRLSDKVKRHGWFSRFKSARSGVVGCAGVVERNMEDLEEAYKAWRERRREWNEYAMNRARAGRGVAREMIMKMLKGMKGGD